MSTPDWTVKAGDNFDSRPLKLAVPAGDLRLGSPCQCLGRKRHRGIRMWSFETQPSGSKSDGTWSPENLGLVSISLDNEPSRHYIFDIYMSIQN